MVTSPTGAVIKDIIHVLTTRFSGFHLILNPVRVQGEGSALEIARAIEEFNALGIADVLIVGRGGGSIEDLWAFNEEVVAKAIFESKIPIVSAVGHETDTTIADLVADVRAPTPSAAAMLVVSEKVQHLQFLEKTRRMISHALSHLISRYQVRLDAIQRHPALSSPYFLLAARLQKTDDYREKLEAAVSHSFTQKKLYLEAKKKQLQALQPHQLIAMRRSQLKQFASRFDQLFSADLRLRSQKLKSYCERLGSLNPKNVLKRGYAILFDENKGSVIVSTHDLIIGNEVRALLSDGEATLIAKKHERLPRDRS